MSKKSDQEGKTTAPANFDDLCKVMLEMKADINNAFQNLQHQLDKLKNDFAPQTAAHGVTLHTLFKDGGAADIANSIAPALNDRFGDYGSRRPDNWPLKFELDIHVTRHTKMPAIVLEVGFFDNPKDADILMNPFAIMEFNKTLLEELKKELI